MKLVPPERGDDWVGLSAEPLPLAEALAWVELPSCGAVVSFSGTVRDHAEGREGVQWLEYEAYDEEAIRRLAAVVAEARRRWPVLGRVVAVHRVGRLELGAAAVVVVVSAPHRAEAFEAARYCIDTLKETVPIWKRESWEGGEAWGTGAADVREAAS